MSQSGDAPIEELKALAHPLRFRILQSLADGERNVGEIETSLPCPSNWPFCARPGW